MDAGDEGVVQHVPSQGYVAAEGHEEAPRGEGLQEVLQDRGEVRLHGTPPGQREPQGVAPACWEGCALGCGTAARRRRAGTERGPWRKRVGAPSNGAPDAAVGGPQGCVGDEGCRDILARQLLVWSAGTGRRAAEPRGSGPTCAQVFGRSTGAAGGASEVRASGWSSSTTAGS